MPYQSCVTENNYRLYKKLVGIFLCMNFSLLADAEQQISTLSLEGKIAQLFIMRFNLDDTQEVFEKKKAILTRYQVGGAIFLCPWDPQKQFEWMQELRCALKISPLYCADAEHGLFCINLEKWGHKIKSKEILRYPSAMALGAIKNDELIYEFGKKIGDDCRAFGIHMNFAPVVDVNNNPENPIIHMRSFGDDPYKVACKARAFFKGLKAGGVLACAKHFCGHGDTAVDSHKDLPEILHNRDRLSKIELVPFRHLIDEGVDAVMTAHIYVPSVDNRLNRPISLSYNGSTKLLRQDLGFKGLVVTDGLDMAGVNRHFVPGAIEKEAFLAGADLLICSVDIAAGISAIKQAVDCGEILEQAIDERVLKILKLKKAVAYDNKYQTYQEVMNYLNDDRGRVLKRALYENAVTVVYDHDNLIPLIDKKIALVEVGCSDAFYQTLSKYNIYDRFELAPSANERELRQLEKKLLEYDTVLFAVHSVVVRIKSTYGLSSPLVEFINDLDKKKMVILFGAPYSLSLFDRVDAAVVAYDNDLEAQRAAAKIVSGIKLACGQLPIGYCVPKKRSP